MPGLNLMGGASVRTNAGYSAQTSQPAPSTASSAAFGPALEPSSGASAFMPTNPAGIAVWVGLAGVALLLFTYYSLPG